MYLAKKKKKINFTRIFSNLNFSCAMHRTLIPNMQKKKKKKERSKITSNKYSNKKYYLRKKIEIIIKDFR